MKYRVPLVFLLALAVYAMAADPPIPAGGPQQQSLQEFYGQRVQAALPDDYNTQRAFQWMADVEIVSEEPSPITSATEAIQQQAVLQDVTSHRISILQEQLRKLRGLRERLEKLDPDNLAQRLRKNLRKEEIDGWREHFSRTASR